MFDDQFLGAEVLKNPASVQGLVLTDVQNRLAGNFVVADPNCSFNLLLEAGASMTAQAVRYMEQQFDSQYPVRATTSAELYQHMSDFDYLSMVAGPSSTTVSLTFDIDYLIANAQSYDATYNRIVIPVGTQFAIGPLVFGIYYPINININKITGNVNVLWDTTTNNPLNALSTNMVPFNQYSMSGLNLITLLIPTSQFNTSTTTYPVVAQQGFIQNISYTDQFYAVRVFTNLPTGSWTELAYTLSETAYDPMTPTAKIEIQNDTNTLNVSIPQIYFTNSQIGNQVMVTIYTTKGAITLDLTSVEVSNCECNFNLGAVGTTAFSMILANLPTISLLPASDVITGGSSALSFAELRNLVINGGLYTTVPVTPIELSTFAQKQGFVLSKYIDNVTDRIYYASNTITGGQNGAVMVTTGTITVSPGAMTGVSTILNFAAEDAVTILPTTLYAFNEQSGVCTPLTDTQRGVLNNMTKQAFATEFNTNTYTQCPFHLVTYTTSQYPVSKSFNLMNPTVDAINFVADNVYLTPQMSAVSGVIVHNSNGTGGYTLRLGVTKTPAMAAIAESNITVYLSGNDINSDVFYGIATLTGTTASLYIYELTIPTTYYLSQRGTFRSTMAVVGDIVSATVDIPLSCTLTLTFLINASLYPSVPQDVALVAGLAAPYNTMLGVAQQKLAVTFGSDLSNELYNLTNATWSSLDYATQPTNVYATYDKDVYETNSQGGLVYAIVEGSAVPVLNKLHSRGDQILDGSGAPIVIAAIGSVVLDAMGQPIVLANRQLQYYVTSMMFDSRIFYSQNQADITFVQNLTATLMAFFSTLDGIQANLLEQTQLFYKPNSTMGTGNFSAGNNVPLSLNLGFSYSLVVYVSQAVLDNNKLLAAMTGDITTIIQQEMTNAIISLTDIATNIKDQLAGTISSVDVDGIDGTTTLQTVIVPAGTTTPIVGQQLVYDIDANTLSLQSAITIKYVLAA